MFHLGPGIQQGWRRVEVGGVGREGGGQEIGRAVQVKRPESLPDPQTL